MTRPPTHPPTRPSPFTFPADEEAHDLGLAHDLPTVLNRRRVLGLLGGGLGLAALAACGSDSTGAATGTSATSTAAATSAASSSAAAASAEIPEETAGPFPGDGSNGPNVLAESGIVRSDITSSFGTSTTKASGTPLTIVLNVLDLSGGSATAYEGAAVYLWHADQQGRYSMYSQGVTNENYLRGVQAADRTGQVTFTSIFPACYDGRWPHLHFEVYPSLSAATSASSKLRTSQLALPEDLCDEVYALDGYAQSVSNLSRVSLSRDMVFSDGVSLQTPTVTGSVGKDLTVTLAVPV
jgi:protocatechuate 3,4-dioxygenase beta subunit